MEDKIINRVANSGLITIDLEDWYDKRPRTTFDVADFLFQGLILRELEFRTALKEFKWESFEDSNLAIYCSADAIVPTWAFMLVSQFASPYAKSIIFCRPEEQDSYLFDRILENFDPEPYRDKRVIIKGCSKYPVPVQAYVGITAKLTPVVQSLMFGEACSNVPLFKRKKAII